MATSLDENRVARTGTERGHAVPEQASLFEPTRVTWRLFFKRLLRGDYKAAGVRIFGGDPESARIALSRILDGRPGRHADWEWIDLILEELGADAREAFVAFVADRYGYERPAKKPDPVRLQEEVTDVRRGVEKIATAVRDLAQEIERIDKRLERERERPR